jgi:hypothetical protein
MARNKNTFFEMRSTRKNTSLYKFPNFNYGDFPLPSSLKTKPLVVNASGSGTSKRSPLELLVMGLAKNKEDIWLYFNGESTRRER